MVTGPFPTPDHPDQVGDLSIGSSDATQDSNPSSLSTQPIVTSQEWSGSLWRSLTPWDVSSRQFHHGPGERENGVFETSSHLDPSPSNSGNGTGIPFGFETEFGSFNSSWDTLFGVPSADGNTHARTTDSFVDTRPLVVPAPESQYPHPGLPTHEASEAGGHSFLHQGQ